MSAWVRDSLYLLTASHYVYARRGRAALLARALQRTREALGACRCDAQQHVAPLVIHDGEQQQSKTARDMYLSTCNGLIMDHWIPIRHAPSRFVVVFCFRSYDSSGHGKKPLAHPSPLPLSVSVLGLLIHEGYFLP